MGKLAWYKRDPDAALQGMFELTLEERGAYNTVLDLIYSRSDKLPDDDRYIAGCCRCDLRVWRRIKKTLIERGKLHIENGHVRNLRATSDVLRALAKVASCREAARTKHAKSGAVSTKNNDLAPADAEQTHLPYARVLESDSDVKKEDPPLVPPKGTKKQCKRSWHDGVILTPELREYAEGKVEGCNPDAMWTQFENHHRAKGTMFVDWKRAWYTWVNSPYEKPMNGGSHERSGEISQAGTHTGGKHKGPASFVEASREVLALRSRQS